MQADLEYGGAFLVKKYQKVFDFYKKNRVRIRRGAIVFGVVATAIIIKLGFRNMDTVVETATAITMDEETYQPFKLDLTKFTPGVPEIDVGQLPLKDSVVNRRMQAMNVADVSATVGEWLNKTGNLCVHLKHFQVPWDIIVFPNTTIINPQIISEGKTRKNIKEENLEGDTTWKQRATSIYLKYFDKELNQKHDTVWFNYAYCLAHYLI